VIEVYLVVRNNLNLLKIFSYSDSGLLDHFLGIQDRVVQLIYLLFELVSVSTRWDVKSLTHERIAYLVEFFSGVLAVLEDDHIDASQSVVPLARVGLVTFSIEVLEVGQGLSSGGSIHHLFKLHSFLFSNSSCNVADINDALNKEGLLLFISTCFLRRVLSCYTIKVLHLDIDRGLFMLLVKNCSFLIGALDYVGCDFKYILVLDHSNERVLHTLKNLYLLVDE
jgi:hypothetical protein